MLIDSERLLQPTLGLEKVVDQLPDRLLRFPDANSSKCDASDRLARFKSLERQARDAPHQQRAHCMISYSCFID